MSILGIVLSVFWVFGLGVIFWFGYYLITTTKRHELERAADIEYQEMKSQDGYVEVSFLRGSRIGTDSEKKARERRSTESGRELVRLEENEKWFFLFGILVAIVALVIYIKIC